MKGFHKLEQGCPDGIPFSKCKAYMKKGKKINKTKRKKKTNRKKAVFLTLSCRCTSGHTQNDQHVCYYQNKVTNDTLFSMRNQLRRKFELVWP